MTLMQQIKKGTQPAPRRLLLYGTQGIGKSTFAASSDSAMFIQTEDGLGEIGCDKFPLATTFDEVMTALRELYTQQHEYATVAIDSLDWLERLIWADVCNERNVTNIEDIGYAKGYVFALDKWRNFLEGLTALRRDKGFTVDPDCPRQDRKVRKPGNGILRPLCATSAQIGLRIDPGMVRRSAVRDLQGSHQEDRRRFRSQRNSRHRKR